MTEPSARLDDPDYAAFAWARYRRLMWWMTGVSVATGIAAIGGLWWSMGEMTIAVALGSFFGAALTVLMAAALMGLVFLSSGTGHDEQVARSEPSDQGRGPR